MTEIVQQLGEFFEKVSFEEKQHRYSIGEYSLKLSVSGVVKKFAEKFDSGLISGFVAKAEGVSQEEILTNWEEIRNEACDRGHRVHLFGELYARNRNLIPSCKQEEAIVKFWNDLPKHIVLIDTELIMYHKELLFGGTADIIAYNIKTRTFIILDYKTNKDLFKNYKGKTLLEPFDFLLDNPFNKYQIQLSLYQILLEQAGIVVSSRKIIWLKKDGNYELFDTEDYTNQMKEYLITADL